ncbi:F-box/kelch-repeat protein At3g06240-like [Mercurialis annua]|uniref:F-box/kelch-repeat protein At3g06240-like n=1 Tax=Mercurialis annua TaxID=3986 RepID=UPI0024AE4F72|nr:F-box/kelch-repeat protein At3g06240-like [Mercurialis annua]
MSLRIMSIADDNHKLVEIEKVHGRELDFGYHVYPQLFGSVNGLLLISLSISLRDFIVWNPTTGEFRKIDRKISKESKYEVMYMAGIGYSSSNGDHYKIVVAESCRLQNNSIEVEIYDLKKSSWKTKKCDFPYKFLSLSFDTPGITLANGIPNWHFKRMNNDRSVILSFDMVDEIFKEIDLPEYIFDFKFMSALEGCLCIGIRNYISDPLCVWKMSEYGRRKSWIKLEVVFYGKFRDDIYIMPLGFLGKGQVIMNYARASIVTVDVTQPGYKFIMQSKHDNNYTVAAFVETLVCPN